MTTPIEFAAANESTDTETSPWAQPRKSTYEDLILKAEYAERQLRFAAGQNWMRIVPALASSVHGWMLPLHLTNADIPPESVRLGNRLILILGSRRFCIWNLVSYALKSASGSLARRRLFFEDRAVDPFQSRK